MLQAWNDYLQISPELVDRYAADLNNYEELKPLREIISHVVARAVPARVACIGAGVLHDIPYHMLVGSGAELVLIDWRPSLVDAGLPYAVLGESAQHLNVCACCLLPPERAIAHCRKFEGNAEVGVCANFHAGGKGRPFCSSYARGSCPDIRGEDATQGVGTAFATSTSRILKSALSWREVLNRAQRAVRDAGRERVPLGIDDGSIDLVISSMLISQFEHEPYNYFMRQAAAILGPPSAREERRLSGRAGVMQGALRRAQIERHVDEISRLLSPNGYCFIAVELFQREPDNRWFWVDSIEEIIALLRDRFDLDLDALPSKETVVRIRIGEQPSLVLCLVLRHKQT